MSTGLTEPRDRGRWRVRISAAVVLGVLVGVVVLAACIGPVRIPASEVVSSISAHLFGTKSSTSPIDDAVIWDLRLPRIVLAALVGAMLSVSGAAYQGVLRNTLADPYLLGVAAGGGLGATVAIVLGVNGTLWLPLAAFVGSLGAVVMTYVIATSGSERGDRSVIILAGVAVAAMLTAIQTFLQQQHTDEIRQIYNWLLGSFSVATWGDVGLAAPYIVVSIVILMAHRRILDVLRVGADEAGTLGLHPTRTRLLIVGAATLGTAAAVSVSGLIGFVGIIVPHAFRLATSASYRVLMPLAMIGGAAFMVLADLIGRTIEAPTEVPIGVVTALVGAPAFLVILRSRRGRGGAL
ncbi:ABC transporter permease [Nocardioides baekrokdamisoli]|uniref:ABC transporter permease n=1 Tax=Nocardioides baekrokdamisoli TaxID=1804624 RepID=A0A3G9IWP5_9ACTN|nr:iron ABC transporter permease [Nocardioides baekrokdamisoli]BBH18111.1 ABC transporter permease [Nocardioides baekrokdamisoli]